ncbi:MAG TPA: hypothetical protein VMC41_03970, partial [Candidatus Nanoarchaeia archaeon]|nr:hypothetical protein [Candidatus Nanoarchaeia archaeon]
TDKGQVLEMPADNQRRFNGKFFRGETRYLGKQQSAADTIKNAWMFMSAKDFISQGEFEIETSRPNRKRIAGVINRSTMEWVECVVIVERPI